MLLCGGKRGSRRPVDCPYRDEGSCVLDQGNRLAETDQATAPVNDPLDDYLALVGRGPLAGLRARALGRWIRRRVLDEARVQSRRVVGVEGTGSLPFRGPHAAPCLTRPCREHTRYGPQALAAKSFGPAQTVLARGTEFSANRERADRPVQAGAQQRPHDGALKAARRLLAGLRQDFPPWHLCPAGDARYAGGAGFQSAQAFPPSLVFVFPEGSLPAWWQEFQARLRLGPPPRPATTEDGGRPGYRWVENLPDVDSAKRAWQLPAIPYPGEGPPGERSAGAWLVRPDLVVSQATGERMVWGAGRPRGREENPGFNVPKPSGLNLEPASGAKDPFGAYSGLLPIAPLLLPWLAKGRRRRARAWPAGQRGAVALGGSLKKSVESRVESVRKLVWPAEVFGEAGPIPIRLASSGASRRAEADTTTGRRTGPSSD